MHPRARDVERDRVDAQADVGIDRVDRPAERAGAAVVERVGHRECLRQEHTAFHRLQARSTKVPTMPHRPNGRGDGNVLRHASPPDGFSQPTPAARRNAVRAARDREMWLLVILPTVLPGQPDLTLIL